MAPFYPLQAKEKGLSVFWIGFVLGSNAFAYILSSLLASRKLHLIGRELAMTLGMLLLTIQQVGLWRASYIKSENWFITFSFIAQVLGGLGSGNNAVASMAMVVSTSDKSERMHNIGLIETATGIGFLLGPLWGSVMYHIGGYPAPFACSGKLNLGFLISVI